MKRILFAGLIAAAVSGSIECRQLYVGTYKTPNMLRTPLEKRESKGGQLEQPGLAWIQGKMTNVTLDRNGKSLKFDITKTMQGDGWSIKQSTDENDKVKFTLCLDRKRFLPGGLEKKGWGPTHSENITYDNNMICFDLDYETPIGGE